MIVELHMLQNFAPANLNRDDTGAPKDCEFGEVRRARISSQAQKRAIRTQFREANLFSPAELAKRSLRYMDQVRSNLTHVGLDAETAEAAARGLLLACNLDFNAARPDETRYLLFIGPNELDGLSRIALAHVEALSKVDKPIATREARKKKDVQTVFEAVEQLLSRGSKAPDLALFGRMLADLPTGNVDAASQVAHAISTNRIEPEFDFFTAVDDLKGTEEDAGAGMMGTVEFNSSCFYRYANIDLKQLRENLGGDEELSRRGLAAFIQAAVTAIPTGKQNSFAAQNPPSLVFAVVRDRGAWSLANAFVKPVTPGRDSDLIGASVRALDNYWGRLTEMYGDATIDALAVSIDREYAACLTNLSEARVPNVPALVDGVLKATSDSAAG